MSIDQEPSTSESRKPTGQFDEYHAVLRENLENHLYRLDHPSEPIEPASSEAIQIDQSKDAEIRSTES